MLGFAGLLAVSLPILEPTASAQTQPAQLNVAIYAPSASFSDSAARLAYVQGLAKAIQAKTGIPATGKAYVRYSDLMAAKPDFAIIDGQCVATKNPGTLLAVAAIDGDTVQRWGLYTRSGDNFSSLKGKKLAYVKSGCRDEDFLDNVMLDSEIKTKGYFGGLVDKPDVAGAVAAVKDYKAADAVFAPSGASKGLSKLFDTGAVPNPGFVVTGKAVPTSVVDKVKDAVLSYGAGGGIDGWKGAQQAGYGGLAGRMGARVKKAVFAVPDVVKMDDQDVLVVPESQFEQASVEQHFWVPPP
jgi:hypothetical protein